MTTLNTYYVGDKPEPLAITVLDSDGDAIDLSFYDTFTAVLLGSDNEEVDLDGAELMTAGAKNGKFFLAWPEDRSVFTQRGDYLVQLVFEGDGRRRATTEHTIRVKELGRLNR